MKRSPKRYVDGWNQADRDDPLSDLNAPHKPRKRKNTKAWCRGKEGVEHTPATVVHHANIRGTCGPSQWMPRRYWCRHAIQCSTCGKYLHEWLAPEQCPDYKKVD